MTSGPSRLAHDSTQTVGISLVRAIVHEFERTGRDAASLLHAAGIGPDILDDPYARLDPDRYRALQRLALERSGDAGFGLTLGEHASLASFGLVGHMVTHCRTLREGLELCVHYYRLVADADAPRVVEHGDRAELVYEFLRSSDLACNRMRAEFGLTRLVLTARALVGTQWDVHEASFEHPAPEYLSRYQAVFGGAARFDCPMTSVSFPTNILDARLVHHDENVVRALRAQADQMLEALEGKEGVAGKLRRAVAGTSPEALDADSLARRLGMSSRALRRQLTREGHTFQEVVARALSDMACSLLRDKTLTIQQIAYRLGFSEPSAFHRAFKRWTGKTPAEFRRAAEEPAGG